MKKITVSLMAIMLFITIGCKKENDKAQDESPIATKYARIQISVWKDINLKKWLATLEKAEAVALLSEEKRTEQIKGKTIITTIAKIKLADDKVGYILPKYLADQPLVFIEDTKALVRPTKGSKVHFLIKKGTIGFIIAEKANWKQIYIGKIEGKWVTKQWINGGYSTDENIIMEAKEYESATRLLKADKKEKAKEKLIEISKSVSAMGDIAREKFDELTKMDEEQSKEMETEPVKEAEPTVEENKTTDKPTEENQIE